MQIFTSKMFIWTAAAALGTASLFAQAPHGRMAQYLNLTTEQRAIFREAGKSAKPLRMQLRQTHQSLQEAIKSGNADQIKQLTAAEGSEKGELAAIRANAMAKLYPTFTAEQRQKLAEFRQSHKRRG
jgi:Spy/CpxP family protein refolding chaperone